MPVGEPRGDEIVVVAAREDAAAAAAVAVLHRRGRRARLVDETTLARAVLVHRPASGPAGEGTAALPGDLLRLPDGAGLGPATRLLAWRLDWFPLGAVAARHREYAEAESFAVGLSWLTGLGDVVLNRPDPFGLPGGQADLVRLAELCRACGVPIAPFELCTNQATAQPVPTHQAWAWEPPGLPGGLTSRAAPVTGPPLPRPVLRRPPLEPAVPALVLDGRVVGDPAVPAAGLARVAAALGLRCAEMSLAAGSDGRAVVTAVSPVPSLRPPGHLAAFVGYLEHRADHAIREEAA